MEHKELGFDYSDYGIQNITWNLYISPIDSFDNFLLSLDGNEEIKIQTYEFTQKTIKKKLHELLQDWTDIQLIMENYKYKQYQNTWNKIEEEFGNYENFQIENDNKMGTNYIHSKINLLDDAFWIQTANLTHSSFFKNREHFFYSENQEILENLEYIFDKDFVWDEIYPEEIHPNLLICNINCRDKIEELLLNAEKSIKIQTQYIIDKEVTEILKQKSDLELEFLLSYTENNYDIMEYFGPWIARYVDDLYIHTKTILIDDEILLVGSMNLSDNSLDNNREVWILLVDDTVIEKYLAQFEKDWKISKWYKWF